MSEHKSKTRQKPRPPKYDLDYYLRIQAQAALDQGYTDLHKQLLSMAEGLAGMPKAVLEDGQRRIRTVQYKNTSFCMASTLNDNPASALLATLSPDAKAMLMAYELVAVAPSGYVMLNRTQKAALSGLQRKASIRDADEELLAKKVIFEVRPRNLARHEAAIYQLNPCFVRVGRKPKADAYAQKLLGLDCYGSVKRDNRSDDISHADIMRLCIADVPQMAGKTTAEVYDLAPDGSQKLDSAGSPVIRTVFVGTLVEAPPPKAVNKKEPPAIAAADDPESFADLENLLPPG